MSAARVAGVDRNDNRSHIQPLLLKRRHQPLEAECSKPEVSHRKLSRDDVTDAENNSPHLSPLEVMEAVPETATDGYIDDDDCLSLKHVSQPTEASWPAALSAGLWVLSPSDSQPAALCCSTSSPVTSPAVPLTTFTSHKSSRHTDQTPVDKQTSGGRGINGDALCLDGDKLNFIDEETRARACTSWCSEVSTRSCTSSLELQSAPLFSSDEDPGPNQLLCCSQGSVHSVGSACSVSGARDQPTHIHALLDDTARSKTNYCLTFDELMSSASLEVSAATMQTFRQLRTDRQTDKPTDTRTLDSESSPEVPLELADGNCNRCDPRTPFTSSDVCETGLKRAHSSESASSGCSARVTGPLMTWARVGRRPTPKRRRQDTQTDAQTDKQTDTQTDIQTDAQTDAQTDKQTDIQVVKATEVVEKPAEHTNRPVEHIPTSPMRLYETFVSKQSPDAHTDTQTTDVQTDTQTAGLPQLTEAVGRLSFDEVQMRRQQTEGARRATKRCWSAVLPTLEFLSPGSCNLLSLASYSETRFDSLLSDDSRIPVMNSAIPKKITKKSPLTKPRPVTPSQQKTVVPNLKSKSTAGSEGRLKGNEGRKSDSLIPVKTTVKSTRPASFTNKIRSTQPTSKIGSAQSPAGKTGSTQHNSTADNKQVKKTTKLDVRLESGVVLRRPQRPSEFQPESRNKPAIVNLDSHSRPVVSNQDTRGRNKTVRSKKRSSLPAESSVRLESVEEADEDSATLVRRKTVNFTAQSSQSTPVADEVKVWCKATQTDTQTNTRTSADTQTDARTTADTQTDARTTADTQTDTRTERRKPTRALTPHGCRLSPDTRTDTRLDTRTDKRTDKQTDKQTTGSSCRRQIHAACDVLSRCCSHVEKVGVNRDSSLLLHSLLLTRLAPPVCTLMTSLPGGYPALCRQQLDSKGGPFVAVCSLSRFLEASLPPHLRCNMMIVHATRDGLLPSLVKYLLETTPTDTQTNTPADTQTDTPADTQTDTQTVSQLESVCRQLAGHVTPDVCCELLRNRSALPDWFNISQSCQSAIGISREQLNDEFIQLYVFSPNEVQEISRTASLDGIRRVGRKWIDHVVLAARRSLETRDANRSRSCDEKLYRQAAYSFGDTCSVDPQTSDESSSGYYDGYSHDSNASSISSQAIRSQISELGHRFLAAVDSLLSSVEESRSSDTRTHRHTDTQTTTNTQTDRCCCGAQTS